MAVDFLKALDDAQNVAYTENGGKALRTSGSGCVDLFSSIGSMRGSSWDRIVSKFESAWLDEKLTALKILFYARDVRGGLGERKVFRYCLAWLAQHYPEVVEKNFDNIAFYGRWDDILCLLDVPALEKDVGAYLLEKIVDDICNANYGKSVSQLAKWLPSENASSAKTRRYATTLRTIWGWSPRRYRKTLTDLRERIRIIENNLRTKDYTFDYSKQPGGAMFKYRQAFLRNDEERYKAYLESLKKGDAKMNAGTLYPYQIVGKFTSLQYRYSWKSPSRDEIDALNTMWDQLPDYTNGENALVVMDGSGSMYIDSYSPTPISAAMSLAIYFAERNKGPFKDCFITFSHVPKLVRFKADSPLSEKVRIAERENDIANTNVSAVFDLILKTAISSGASQSDMPTKLYIISDMEFDMATTGNDKMVFEHAKEEYEAAGYKLPQLVFWNVCSRTDMVPVKQDEKGVALVSGASPSIFKLVMSGEADPYQFMRSVIDAERYERVKLD